MTGEGKLTEYRQWVHSVLDLLGAAPDRQLEYLRTAGVGVDEILLQFDDVLHVARARLSDGSMKQEDYLLLQKIASLMEAVSAGPESIWAEAALGEAIEWRELRAAARSVKSALERSWNGTGQVS